MKEKTMYLCYIATPLAETTAMSPESPSKFLISRKTQSTISKSSGHNRHGILHLWLHYGTRRYVPWWQQIEEFRNTPSRNQTVTKIKVHMTKSHPVQQSLSIRCPNGDRQRSPLKLVTGQINGGHSLNRPPYWREKNLGPPHLFTIPATPCASSQPAGLAVDENATPRNQIGPKDQIKLEPATHDVPTATTSTTPFRHSISSLGYDGRVAMSPQLSPYFFL
jgi:hypothetical protein